MYNYLAIFYFFVGFHFFGIIVNVSILNAYEIICQEDVIRLDNPSSGLSWRYEKTKEIVRANGNPYNLTVIVGDDWVVNTKPFISMTTWKKAVVKVNDNYASLRLVGASGQRITEGVIVATGDPDENDLQFRTRCLDGLRCEEQGKLTMAQCDSLCAPGIAEYDSVACTCICQDTNLGGPDQCY